MLHTQAVELAELKNDESLFVPRSNSATLVHSGAPIFVAPAPYSCRSILATTTAPIVAGGHVEQEAEREPTQAVHRL